VQVPSLRKRTQAPRDAGEGLKRRQDRTISSREVASDVTPHESDGQRRAYDARVWIRHAWITGVLHATGSSLVLLTSGVNLVLAAHYPLVSALAILLLAFGIRRGSRAAALLLFLATLTPAAIKIVVGMLHLADLPAFPLAALYLRGFAGTVRQHRLRGDSAGWPAGGRYP
jgi:hypothetical protein